MSKTIAKIVRETVPNKGIRLGHELDWELRRTVHQLNRDGGSYSQGQVIRTALRRFLRCASAAQRGWLKEQIDRDEGGSVVASKRGALFGLELLEDHGLLEEGRQCKS